MKRPRERPRGPFQRELSTRITELLSSADRTTSSTEILRQILDAAVEATEAERGFLLRLENGQGCVAASRNCDEEDVSNSET